MRRARAPAAAAGPRLSPGMAWAGARLAPAICALLSSAGVVPAAGGSGGAAAGLGPHETRLYAQFAAVTPSARELRFTQSCAGWRPVRDTCNASAKFICNVDERDCACECDAVSTFCAAAGTPAFDPAAPGSIVAPVSREGAPRHFTIVGGRVRISGATDVKFLGPAHFVTMSFAAHELYLFRFSTADRTAAPVAVARTTHGGELVSSDLVDWDGGFRLLVSNLFSGTQTEYRVDVSAETLVHVVDHAVFAGGARPAKCHSASFVPGRPELVLATNSRRGGVGYHTDFYDAVAKRTLLRIPTHSAWYPQDTAFLEGNPRWLFVAYTTTRFLKQASGKSLWDSSVHVAEGQRCIGGRLKANKMPSHLRVTLYDVDVDRATHAEVQTVFVPGAHPDALVYKGGVLFVTDQINDVIHMYAVGFAPRRAADGGGGVVSLTPLAGLSPFRGFHMPHGVDVAHGCIAVASYGDNSVKVMPLPERVLAAMADAKRATAGIMPPLLPDPSLPPPNHTHHMLPQCDPGRPCTAEALEQSGLRARP